MTDSAPSRPRNPAGLASLVAGVLVLLCGLAATGASVALPRLVDSYGASYGTISLLINVPSVLLALVALALGIVGLLLKDRPRTAAIIGTTLGAAHLVAAGGGLLLTVLVGALLY